MYLKLKSGEKIVSNEEITKERIEELQKKNQELREKIIQELGKINQEILLWGEITIENPYDNHSDLIVEETTTEVITVGDGRNYSCAMLVASMDNRTLLSILSQVCHANKRLKEKNTIQKS